MIETLASLALDAGHDLLAPPTAKSESGTARPADWLISALGGGPTASGVLVSPDSAMRLATVWACVTVISESVAGLPLFLYRRDGKDKQRDTSNPLYDLLHSQPNRVQTSFEWREQSCVHLLLRGNAYSYLRLNGRGEITEILPMHPDRVTILESDSGDLYYRYQRPDARVITLPSFEVFHLRGKVGSDGIYGISPISATREAFGLAQAAEEYGARLFSNSLNAGGFIKLPERLGEEAKANVIKYLQQRHSGLRNALKVGLLDAGMEWVQTSISPEDAQFLELRKYQREEICSIFRVPPHMAGDLSRATNNNIEHQSLEFVMHTLRPWLVRWEQAIARDLLGARERNSRFAEFQVDGLLRGDVVSRWNAHFKAFQSGAISPNEIRALESMNQVEGLDDHYVPANMVPVGQARKAS